MAKDELPKLELPHSDRVQVAIHRSLHRRIRELRQSDEHGWQTIHRLLLAGIAAEQRKGVRSA